MSDYRLLCQCDELCCTVASTRGPAAHGSQCTEPATVSLLLEFKPVDVCKGCDQRISDRELRRYLTGSP